MPKRLKDRREKHRGADEIDKKLGELADAVARSRVSQHVIEEKVTAMENVINQIAEKIAEIRRQMR